MIRALVLLTIGWMILSVIHSKAYAQSHEAVQAVENYCRHASAPVYDGYVEGRITPGNVRTLGDFKLFVPLWQANGRSLLFADLRGQMDDSSNYEGNWGAGFRHLTDNDWVLGSYGFYDSRWSYTGHQYNQMTLGIEAMSVDHELRMNGYLPDTNTKSIAGAAPSVELIGNQLVLITPNQQYEVAYYGLDAEYGRLLYSWGPNNDIEWRAFAGAYHFDSDEDVPDITGPRLRTELRLFDLKKLGEGSRVTLEGIYQWDQVRKDQYFAGATVRIPFGPGSGKLNPLQRRMLDRVVRDVDVIVTEGVAEGTEIQEDVVYEANGAAIDQVETLSSGDDFASTVSSSPSNTLFVVNGTHTGSFNTVILKQGQQLVGGGQSFQVRGQTTGTVATYTTTGDSAVLNNYTLALTDNNVVQGVTSNGRFISPSADNVVIRQSHFVNDSYIENVGRILIEDSSFTNTSIALNPTASALSLSGNNVQATIRRSEIISAGSFPTSRIELTGTSNLLLEDSTLGLMGFYTTDPGSISNITFRNNQSQQTVNGIVIVYTADDVKANVHISGNTPRSASDGIILSAYDSSTIYMTQASAAALAADNGILVGGISISEDPGGMVLFGGATPALPTWP